MNKKNKTKQWKYWLIEDGSLDVDELQQFIDENTGLECVLVSKISVPDAFGGFGEVTLVNEFAKEIK